MGPTRRAGWLALGVSLVALAAGPASGEPVHYAAAPPDFAFDPVERSPRLLGMGGLVYTVEDEHNRITLWDFARNPIGLLEDRDSSSIDVWGGFASSTRYRNETLGLVRQDLAASDRIARAEVWRRTPGRFFYGVEAAGVSAMRSVPASENEYERAERTFPAVRGVLGGAFPWERLEAFRWTLRILYLDDDLQNDLHYFRQNPSGFYLGGNENRREPRNFFDPDEGNRTGLGVGAMVSCRLPGSTEVALGGDWLLHDDIRLANQGDRYSSTYTEERPLLQGQMSAVGGVGGAVRWGLDGRTFRAAGDQEYEFTVSAGIGGTPIAGKGKRQEVDENGSSLRARASVDLPGGLRLGGGATVVYRRTQISPAAPGDPTSFNRLINHIYRSQPDADSLVLPDTVSARDDRVHAYAAGGGLSWSPGTRLVVGAEVQFGRDRRDGEVAGVGVNGPYRELRDARAGIEYRCSQALVGRAGYVFRDDDADLDSGQDEIRGHALTLGAGYHAPATHWSAEAGYSIEWVKAGYDDPTELRGGNQVVALNLRWRF